MNKQGNTFVVIIVTMILTMLFCYVVLKITSYKIILDEGLTFSTSNDEQPFSKLEKVKQIIDSSYLREYDDKELIDDAISGMITALNDPYAAYYNEQAFETLNTQTEGEYEGIGIYITYDEEKKMPIIITPIVGSPAAETGILPGDYIEYVDDVDATQVGYEELVDKIKGKSDSFVKIGILRENANNELEKLEFNIQRHNIEINPITEEVYENDIGYIKLTSFDGVAYDNFREKYEDLINNKKVKGLIIDLRNNPGGVLDICVKITDIIVPSGRIVYTVDKQGNEENYDFETDGTDKEHIEIPLVVLVNNSSASASEVFTGAIKDYKVGTIIGEKTYGKGVVQTLKSLRDGTYIKLTTSEYFSPNGNKIDGIGITPDIEVSLPDDVSNEYLPKFEEDTQLQRAIQEIKSKLTNAS